MRPSISIDQFNYPLPESKIAKYPLANRENSKLLIYRKNQSINETQFSNIISVIPQKSLILFNNTKVIRARLLFQKPTGAKIEIFCLEPANDLDIQLSFSQTNKAEWICIVGNLKKWKQGLIELTVNNGDKRIIVRAEKLEQVGDSHHIRFSWSDSKLSFGEIIELIGKIPIPPYLNRDTEEIDSERYQTVYSEYKGSVAAPTAGLHFTPDIINQLNKQNIKTDYLTLHVGAGTFKPVKSESITDHEMHVEHFSVNKSTIINLINHNGPIIAVGTTTTRTLESLYWLGVQLKNKSSLFHVSQWEAYEKPSNLTFTEALQYLLDYLEESKESQIHASTGIMIAPGYQFRAIDGLITNFHQPKSTLLLLISALIGEDWKKIYNYALDNNFRFLSYGDSSIIL